MTRSTSSRSARKAASFDYRTDRGRLFSAMTIWLTAAKTGFTTPRCAASAANKRPWSARRSSSLATAANTAMSARAARREHPRGRLWRAGYSIGLAGRSIAVSLEAIASESNAPLLQSPGAGRLANLPQPGLLFRSQYIVTLKWTCPRTHALDSRNCHHSPMARLHSQRHLGAANSIAALPAR